MSVDHPSDIIFRFQTMVKGCDLCIRIRAYKKSIDHYDMFCIEDAVSSYVDTVDDWTPEVLIRDVMSSFDFDYEFVSSWHSFGPKDELDNTIYI